MASYLFSCHVAWDKFVGLIGDPDVDHNYWGRPEQQEAWERSNGGSPRKAYVWTRAMPASDLLGMVRKGEGGLWRRAGSLWRRGGGLRSLGASPCLPLSQRRLALFPPHPARCSPAACPAAARPTAELHPGARPGCSLAAYAPQPHTPLPPPPAPQTSAALSSASMLLKTINPLLSEALLAKAQALYTWAKSKLGAQRATCCTLRCSARQR